MEKEITYCRHCDKIRFDSFCGECGLQLSKGIVGKYDANTRVVFFGAQTHYATLRDLIQIIPDISLEVYYTGPKVLIHESYEERHFVLNGKNIRMIFS
jgi:hypothetical protein